MRRPSVLTRWAGAFALIVAASSCSAQCSGSSAAHVQGPNLVVNGDFETPKISQQWTLIANGNTSLMGWTVSGNGVEIISSAYWQPESGKQSVNLSSNGTASAVAQTIKTTNGTSYQVRWYISANPQCVSPKTRGMDVIWNGKVITTVRFGISGHSFKSMGWTAENLTVKATGSTSTIIFERSAATDGSCGVAIDNVSVRS